MQEAALSNAGPVARMFRIDAPWPTFTRSRSLWPVSDESGFATGINVPVDDRWAPKGGLTAKSGVLEQLQSTVGEPG